MPLKVSDYTDISYLGTTGQTAKTIYTVGSTGDDNQKSFNVLVYDVTICNQTGTGGQIRLFSDIGTSGSDVYIYASALETVHVKREVPFRWKFYGSTGVKQHVYASSFAGAGVKTYIGAILQ